MRISDWSSDVCSSDLGRVARTATRPIPSGAVSPRQALLFMALLLLLGLLVLLQFNGAAILTGLASMPLVLAYPLMKRVTWWPQAFLGLTFNWGALVGWAAMTGGLDPATFLLYAAGIAWTLGYDTIYAHQDKADDLLIGIKSTALKFGACTKPWLWAFYGATILLLGAAGGAAGMTWPYRSEEHTSELQSLMHISYAVFCLNKTKHT